MLERSQTLAPETDAPATAPAELRVGIGIATSGRPAILTETLREIARQIRLPERVIVCPAAEADVERDRFDGFPFPVEVVNALPGLTRQRNAILRASQDLDALVFFDDDFLPEPHFLAYAESILTRRPDVAVVTGRLIEDGIHGPGLSVAYGRSRLEADAPPDPEAPLRPYYGAYGCNMVVRLAPVRANRLQFDEALPLYGWQEDIDFSRQVAPFGEIVKTDALVGVHLGVKRGRSSGVRMGYSQVANPLYLVRKGAINRRFALWMMRRNLAANLARSVWPEPHVDRRGRLKGNAIAMIDLLRGRLRPERILDLE